MYQQVGGQGGRKKISSSKGKGKRVEQTEGISPRDQAESEKAQILKSGRVKTMEAADKEPQPKSPVRLLNEEPVNITSKPSPEFPEVEVKPAEIKPTEIFLPSPSAGGTFDARNARTQFRDGESLYKLFLKSESEAEFELINQRTVINVVLNMPEVVVDPVCESNFVFGQSFQSVKTESRGTLRLEGEYWVLTSKAKLIFE